jgi:hypothetical protein
VSTAETTFDEKGYPIYCRPDKNDQRVVPHNKDILLDWDGHSNLEFAASTYCIFYLYKYLFKGNKKVQLSLNNISDIQSNDEINIFLRGRMITSMDAMWRVFGYKTYPSPFPSVILIKPKTPADVNDWMEKGKLTDIYVYFQRPQSLRHLKICEFFTLYDYKYKLVDARFSNNDNPYDDEGNLRYFVVQATKNVKKFYIYKRLNPDHQITRLNGIPPDAGEIYYIRLMFRELPFKSFTEMLTVNGIICKSFQDATYQRGLLANNSEAYDTLLEARLYQPPSGLRALFVLLTIQGFPTLPIYENLEVREDMYTDFVEGITPAAISAATQKLLEDLNERFSRHGKDMTIYGLPKPLILKSELEQEEELVGDPVSNAEWLRQLHITTPNTDEMTLAYNEITRAIINGSTAFFTIIGVGGAGKTQFAKKVLILHCIMIPSVFDTFYHIIRYLRSQDHSGK